MITWYQKISRHPSALAMPSMEPMKDEWTSKFTATGVKLTSSNYHLWATAFENFLAVHRKSNHLRDDQAVEYSTWYATDCAIVG